MEVDMTPKKSMCSEGEMAGDKTHQNTEEQSVCSVSRSTVGGPAGQLFKFFKVITQINKSLNELSSMFPS